jgi:hypothetical protein
MMAAGLSSLGRGEDKMLVHMTPHEVGGLRQLAMAAGGDLSINPATGLPEAGFLSSLLPMLAGGLLTMTGVGAPLAAGIVAAGDTAITGSWKKGLMAGLGAYGGASLASGLGAAGATTNLAQEGTDMAAKAATATNDALAAANPAADLSANAARLASEGTNVALPEIPAGASTSFLPPEMAPTIAPATPPLGTLPAENGIASLAPPPAAPIPPPAPIPMETAAAGPNPLVQPASMDSLNAGQQAAYKALPANQQAAYLQNLGTRQAEQAAIKAGTWNPSFGQAASNMKSGLGSLNSMQGWGNLGANMGKMGMAGVAVPTLQAINASQQQNIPTQPQTPAEFYQTEYDPRTQTYKRGSWSTQFAGQGYTGAPGKDQSTSKGPLGSYANPYNSIAVDPYAVTGKEGGSVKHMATGGQSSSNLQDYYKGLMSGTNSTSKLQQTDPSANNAFMASLGQGTAPTTPIGGTNMGFLSNQQAQSATNPYGYVAPPPGATGATAPSEATMPPGATGAAADFFKQFGGFGGGFGGMYGTTSPDASGPAMIPSFNWDPVTQTYKQTSSGYGGYGGFSGGIGKAAGGGIGSLNAFAGGGTTLGSYSDGGRLLKGPGDGMSDSIPAHITGQHPQPAALADGEFVIPADVVSHLGNGSTDAGSKVLYKMMDKVRRARTGNPKQGRQINPHKFIPV